jgi:hypothetical protein
MAQLTTQSFLFALSALDSPWNIASPAFLKLSGMLRLGAGNVSMDADICVAG